MKLAIVRTGNGALNINKYNVQEIGLGSSLLKFGFTVDLYSTFIGVEDVLTYKEFNKKKLNLIPIYGVAYKQVTYYPKLISNLLSKDYDIVQVHEDSQLMNSFILKALHQKGVKTVLYQGMYVDYTGIGYVYQKLLEFFVLNNIKKHTDVFLCKTTSALDYLAKKGINKTITLPIGLDVKPENKNTILPENINSFRKKYDTLFLYIGVFEKRRNIFFLVDVLNDLVKKNISCGLVLVGTGPDLNDVLSYINENNLTDYICHNESIPNDEIGMIYRICDMFWLASGYEIYGMVLLEAMYYGLPVLSSYTAGSIDLIRTKILGELVPMDRGIWVESAIKFIESGLINNNKLLRKEHVVDNYNWDVIAKKYKKIILGNEDTLY